MPVREKTVSFLAMHVLGEQVWNGASGVCRTMDTSDWYAVRDVLDSIYVRIMESTDWNRIIREAQSRHLHMEHGKKDDDDSLGFGVKGVCGECIGEAVLALGFGAADWERTPVSPREDPESFTLPDMREVTDEQREAAIKWARALGSEGTFG